MAITPLDRMRSPHDPCSRLVRHRFAPPEVASDTLRVSLAPPAAGTVAEGAEGSFRVGVEGSTADGAVTVSYSVSGTATAGSDYTALSGAVTVSQGDSALVPGVEMVLTLDSAGLPLKSGSWTHEPAEGRHALTVVAVPDMELTLVPILSTQNPDSSVIHGTKGLTEDSPWWRGSGICCPSRGSR